MSQFKIKFTILLFHTMTFMELHQGRRFTQTELERLRDKTVLVKLDLGNVTEFTSLETVSVIFYYRTLSEVSWIDWLERSLPIIYPTPVGIVNCDGEQNYYLKEDCINLGYRPPSLRAYRYGYTHSEYTGDKNARDFVKYIQKISPSRMIRFDLNEIEGFLAENNRTVVVGFFNKESDLEKVFIEVAKKFRGPIFGYCTDDLNNIVLFRPKFLDSEYEDNFVNYNGVADVKVLEEFIKSNQHGLVGIRTYFNVDEFPKPQIIVYTPDFNVRKLILPVAVEYKNITFGLSNKMDFMDDLKEYGIEQRRMWYSNVLVLAQTRRNHKYVLNEFKTVKHLRDFADDFERGMLAQFIKSQDLKYSRPHSESSPINLAVGSNFLQLVNKNSKDLLVLLFKFDCLQTLISMDFTAKEFVRESDKVGFIAMNVQLNDVPHPFYFSGCPTIFFAGRGFKSNPVLYGGHAEYKKLHRFMREQRAEHDKKRK